MKKTCLLSLLLIAVFSCSEDYNDCTNEILETTSLELEYGCVNTGSEMDINLMDDFVVISTQDEFDATVTGSCFPEIDFDIYDLIIGKHGLPSGYDTIETKLIEDCETKSLTLYVDFILNDTLIAPNVTYHALVSKIDNIENLQVVVMDIED